MVNNSTNINKTNLSPQITEHKKNMTTYLEGYPGPGLRHAQSQMWRQGKKTKNRNNNEKCWNQGV